jgi:hypothetical protein
MIVMGKFSFVFVLGFVLMISMQNIAVVVAQSCPAAERDALLAFKAGITEDSSGQLTTWVATTDCCTWFGILCKNGHVIELWLDGGGSGAKWGHLTGPLGSSLFTLLELEVLVLSETQNLTGPISPTIGNLTNLVRLDFRSNKLTGSIPSSVGNLKKLKRLSLGGNPITGSIPSSIGTIGDSLNNIYLGESSLSGSLPNSLFQLSSLTGLFLGVSNLSGSLSPLVGNLGPNLTVLDLSSNSFSGALPPTLGQLTKVLVLDLSFNKFTGQIPVSIGNIGATLFNLNLANNELTGHIPPMFAKQLTGLAALGLENNQLTGPIPQGAPFSNLSVDSFTPGNPGLCGHPLPPCTGGNRKKLL